MPQPLRFEDHRSLKSKTLRTVKQYSLRDLKLKNLKPSRGLLNVLRGLLCFVIGELLAIHSSSHCLI